MRRCLQRDLDHQRGYGYGLYTVVLKASGEIIGDCGLEHMNGNRRIAELGYDLRSGIWGRGFATAAAAAVRDRAFGWSVSPA